MTQPASAPGAATDAAGEVATLAAGPHVTWTADTADHPARLASLRSATAVAAGRKDAWLALFAGDGVVEDPVGPSAFDPEARGHHGRDGIAAFWDLAVAQAEGFHFTVRDSYANGDSCANVGTITAYLPGNMRIDTDGVFVYRVGPDGLICSLRAHWEVDRAVATLRPR